MKIVKLLSEKPYGLSIEEISGIFGISRTTASKYLMVLEAEKKIVVREIGNTKLHYPKGLYAELEVEKWIISGWDF